MVYQFYYLYSGCKQEIEVDLSTPQSEMESLNTTVIIGDVKRNISMKNKFTEKGNQAFKKT